jgi:hypothetical protein
MDFLGQSLRSSRVTIQGVLMPPLLLMEHLPPLTTQAQNAILRQFRVAYGVLVIFFVGAAIVAVAWHWSLPKDYASGFPFRRAALILLGAAVMVNGLSFFIQGRYLQGLLKQPDIASQFSVWKFALRFYGYNLAIAVAFSILGFYPLILVVFFFAQYPIIFWLLPYHLPLGFILGWMIQRQLS